MDRLTQLCHSAHFMSFFQQVFSGFKKSAWQKWRMQNYERSDRMILKLSLLTRALTHARTLSSTNARTHALPLTFSYLTNHRLIKGGA